jgi:Tfp pilus assembly protein PilZ
MTDERRNEERVPASIEVLWVGNAGKYESRTSDLSLGGCFVDTVGQVELGNIVTVTLQLPAGESIEIEGEVVYTYPSMGFGLRFTTVSDSDRTKLEGIIKAAAYREGEQE